MSGNEHAIRYRPDIDGLRAVAVVSVVLYHAGVTALGGGYVGVDVFFVISGFLITGILLKDASILRFYQRRARRILPALFALLLAVLIAGVTLMLPYDTVGVAKSVVATLGFVSNVLFWRKSDYFAHETELWPLLHTWSLGVEEQFYIAFPIVVRLARRLERRALGLLFTGLGLLSYIVAAYAVGHNQGTPAFYLSPPRAWELLAGSVLATGLLPEARGWWLRSLAATAGLAALLYAIAGHTGLPFPGPGALPPVLGSALLIWAGGGGRHMLSPVLGWKPVIFVGLISYSLYLWHWPVLAFARYVAVVPLSAAQAGAAVALAFGLATLSWRFVERPFRRHSVSERTVWLFSGAGVVLLGLAASGLIAGRGLPERIPPAIAKLNAVDPTWRCPITRFVRFGALTACPLDAASADPRKADIVLWGDSHAQMYAPALAGVLGDRHGLLVYSYGCAPVSGDAATAACGVAQRTNYAAIRALPAQTVILAENWPQYRDEASARLGRDPLPEERYGDGIRRLREVVAGLRSAGKRVVIVGPVSVPGYDVASNVSRELFFHGRVTDPVLIPRLDFEREYGNVLKAMADLARDPDVRVVRVDADACDAEACPFVRGGEAVFADHGHFTTRSAESFAPLFGRAVAGW